MYVYDISFLFIVLPAKKVFGHKTIFTAINFIRWEDVAPNLLQILDQGQCVP